MESEVEAVTVSSKYQIVIPKEILTSSLSLNIIHDSPGRNEILLEFDSLHIFPK